MTNRIVRTKALLSLIDLPTDTPHRVSELLSFVTFDKPLVLAGFPDQGMSVSTFSYGSMALVRQTATVMPEEPNTSIDLPAPGHNPVEQVPGVPLPPVPQPPTAPVEAVESHPAEVVPVVTSTPYEDGLLPVLDVQDLTVRYGTHTAVKGISFQVYPGEVLGILGHNGAGKSSTMRRISGSDAPSAGKITVSGYSLTDPSEINKALKLTGYCPDLGGLVPTATPRDLMTLALRVQGKTHLEENIIPILHEFELFDRIDSATRNLSHGEKRRLSVILAIISATDLLILDEPFDGVDPQGTKITQAIIGLAKESGLAVVLSTHLQQVLATTVDRVIVISNGSIIAEGESSQFLGPIGEEYYVDLLTRNQADHRSEEKKNAGKKGLVT